MIKLLIVDDQEDIRRLLRMATEDVAAEVHEACDGPQAMAAWEQKRPDIILLDVMMPGGLTGFDVCRAIRARGGQQPKIIIVSARERLDHHYEGFEAGADDYLIKPFNLQALVAVIHQMAQELLGQPPDTQSPP
jgi:DNA-binding response OmpR family regulator